MSTKTRSKYGFGSRNPASRDQLLFHLINKPFNSVKQSSITIHMYTVSLILNRAAPQFRRPPATAQLHLNKNRICIGDNIAIDLFLEKHREVCKGKTINREGIPRWKVDGISSHLSQSLPRPETLLICRNSDLSKVSSTQQWWMKKNRQTSVSRIKYCSWTWKIQQRLRRHCSLTSGVIKSRSNNNLSAWHGRAASLICLIADVGDNWINLNSALRSLLNLIRRPQTSFQLDLFIKIAGVVRKTNTRDFWERRWKISTRGLGDYLRSSPHRVESMTCCFSPELSSKTVLGKWDNFNVSPINGIPFRTSPQIRVGT